MEPVEAIKQLMVTAGATWVLWLLAGLSALSVAIAAERWLFLQARSADIRGLAAGLDQSLVRGDVTAALAALDASPAVAAAIAAAGLRLAHLGPAAVDKAMRSAMELERSGLERRLAFLGTLGNNAPFVGLFGTVIGIIGAFEELGHGAPGHGASAASQVASQAVMSSIAEALVTTAVGIAVALPAVAIYNALQRKVVGLMSGADVLANLVLAYVSATPGAMSRPAAPGSAQESA